MATSKKEISTNPAGNAVTSPTDPTLKEKDIDRKMRLYGVIEAFRQGNLPSNSQIEETLKYVETHSPVHENKLSKEGKKLIHDVREIIATARKLVLKKNEDELFQNFMYHTRHVDTDKINPANNVESSLNKNDAQADGQQALEHLKTLAKLIYTNAEFRKILKDLTILTQDVAADAAQKAANVARPKDEHLNQIDETAPSNRWHGPDGQVHGPNDSVPDTGLGEKKEKAQQARDQYVDGKEQLKGHAKDAANRAAGSAQDQPGQEGSAAAGSLQQKAQEVIPDEHQDKARAHADDAQRRVDSAVASASGPHDGVPRDTDRAQNLTEDEQRAAKEAGKQTAKDKIKGVIPEEHREKVSAQIGEAKDYLSDKIPKERRERFIYRLKKVVVEQQRHRNYQEAIDFFLGQLETYQGHAKDIHAQSKDHAQSNVRGDPTYAKAELELRTLVERFANNTSSQPIWEALNVIYTDAQNDPELRKWFSDADSYVRRVLQEPGYIMQDECDADGRKLRENSKGLFNERYRPHREALFNEIQNFFTAFADDPLNKRFGDSWKTLTRDLFLDSEGNLKYKSHLWNDVRSVILPDLFKHIGYVPIPRIEYTDNQIDLVIENLTLESQNLLPNIFEIDARTRHKLSPYSEIVNHSKHSIAIEFSQIQADLKNVAFMFRRKSGFPKISDRGLADVFIGGSGITGKVHLESSEKRGRIYNVQEVKVKIDTLNFKIRDSKHNVLYAMLRPLATSLIKKQIQKAIQDAIRSGLGALDAQLVEIRDRLDEAKDDDDTSRLDVLKQVFNEKKSKTQDTKEKSGHFAIVAKRESKLLDWESKNSMVGKQAEREEHAVKGAGWKSAAFDIVPGAHTDVSKPSKGLTDNSNVPTRDFKQQNPNGAQVIDKPATEAGAAVAGVGAGAAAVNRSSNTGVSSTGRDNFNAAGVTDVNPLSQQREPAAGAVAGGALAGGPLGASAAHGAGASSVSPPNTLDTSYEKVQSQVPHSTTTLGTATNSGLPPPIENNY